MKKIFSLLLMLALFAQPTLAQVSVPNTFVTGTPILASEMNANFDALESGSLNRTGGTITGNIAVDSGITVDGIDIGSVLGGTGTPTFSTLTVTGATSLQSTLNVTGNFAINTDKFNVTAASGNVDIEGTLTTGSSSVQLTSAGGKIQAISSTYFDSLDGTNLTGIAKLASSNTYTAINKFFTYSETKTAPTIGGGALAIDLSAGTRFNVSLDGNATITISNPVTSGEGGSFVIKFTNDGTLRTLTWPGSVLWSQATVYSPTATNGKVDYVTCLYDDGGTTYYCTSILDF